MWTLGSLFDGIGGFPLAAVHNGIKPVWASEVEAFPIRVTKIHFPEIEHLGDITKVDGTKYPSCGYYLRRQPLSGFVRSRKRKGLSGERSGLFMEQVRIVKEMRDADGTRGISDDLRRPRYMVWENVPGAFSTAAGEDFRAVLAGDRPDRRTVPVMCLDLTPGAGNLLGLPFWENDAAWLGECLDAQYWGVPQRRRRIFLVADFGGLTAPKILFEPERVPWGSWKG